MSTSGKAGSTTTYNLNPSFPSNTVMFKKASNDCQDFGGAKEPKTDLYKNAATLLKSQLKSSHVENEMIEPNPNTIAPFDASI
jgi:hypothetical protein